MSDQRKEMLAKTQNCPGDYPLRATCGLSCEPTPCPSPSLPHRAPALAAPAHGRNAAPTEVQSQPYLSLTPPGAYGTPVGPLGTHSSQAPSTEVSAGPASLGVHGPGSPAPLTLCALTLGVRATHLLMTASDYKLDVISVNED